MREFRTLLGLSFSFIFILRLIFFVMVYTTYLLLSSICTHLCHPGPSAVPPEHRLDQANQRGRDIPPNFLCPDHSRGVRYPRGHPQPDLWVMIDIFAPLPLLVGQVRVAVRSAQYLIEHNGQPVEVAACGGRKKTGISYVSGRRVLLCSIGGQRVRGLKCLEYDLKRDGG